MLSMADSPTRVDVVSLEDFRATLNTRLTAANSLLRTLENSVDAQPPLGGFVDAGHTASRHGNRRDAQLDRVHRLVAAIQAAQVATDLIISNYRTAEARNTANVTDIAAALDGVHSALSGATDV
jgi:hypothetical protein